jgi:hypothetical protein
LYVGLKDSDERFNLKSINISEKTAEGFDSQNSQPNTKADIVTFPEVAQIKTTLSNLVMVSLHSGDSMSIVYGQNFSDSSSSNGLVKSNYLNHSSLYYSNNKLPRISFESDVWFSSIHLLEQCKSSFQGIRIAEVVFSGESEELKNLTACRLQNFRSDSLPIKKYCNPVANSNFPISLHSTTTQQNTVKEQTQSTVSELALSILVFSDFGIGLRLIAGSFEPIPISNEEIVKFSFISYSKFHRVVQRDFDNSERSKLFREVGFRIENKRIEESRLLRIPAFWLSGNTSVASFTSSWMNRETKTQNINPFFT